MKIKISVGDALFTALLHAFLVLCATIALFPFLNVIAISLSGSRAIMSGEVFLWPVDFTADAYKNLINDGQLFKAFGNSALITAVGTALNMVMTIMAAYPLSKRNLLGGRVMMSLIVFTMLFNGGLIPSFLLVKNLGIMDSFAALWLPAAISVYNMIIMKSFFENIPQSLIEAAQIDGANDIYILIRLVLPLSMPVIATLSWFYCVRWWNNYLNAMIYITSGSKLPITVKLVQMISNFNDTLLTGGEGVSLESRLIPEAVKSAAIVIATAPMLIVFPFLQKYFVKGVMIGSVKG